MMFGVAPQSSWTLNPLAPDRTASSSRPDEVEDPRARKAALTGVWDHPWIRVWRLYRGLAPTSQTPPIPIPTMVVTPVESAAGTSSALDRWTWESTTPGVAIIPSPVIMAAAASTS